MTNKWIAEKSAKEILNIGRTTLWKLRSKGLLHYAKIGRRTLYHLPTIEKFILSNSTLSYENSDSHNGKSKKVVDELGVEIINKKNMNENRSL